MYFQISVGFLWIFHWFLEFEGLCISLKIDGTAGIFLAFQYSGNRLCTPLIQIIQHCTSFPPGMVRCNRQYLICGQDFCNLHCHLDSNTEVKDTTHHSCSLLVYHPFIFILRVFDISVRRIAGNMFPASPTHFNNRTDFFACVFGVIVVKYIFEPAKSLSPFAMSTSSLMAIKRTA